LGVGGAAIASGCTGLWASEAAIGLHRGPWLLAAAFAGRLLPARPGSAILSGLLFEVWNSWGLLGQVFTGV